MYILLATSQANPNPDFKRPFMMGFTTYHIVLYQIQLSKTMHLKNQGISGVQYELIASLVFSMNPKVKK